MIRSTVGVNIVKRQLTGGDHIEDIHQIRRLDETGGRELSVGVVRYRQSGGQVDVIHRTGKGLIVQAFIKRFQQLARDVLRQLGSHGRRRLRRCRRTACCGYGFRAVQAQSRSRAAQPAEPAKRIFMEKVVSFLAIKLTGIRKIGRTGFLFPDTTR